MGYIDSLGMIAGLLTTFAYLPQVFKTWKTKSVNDISLLMLLTLGTGVFLWFVYGVLINSLPVILANGLTFALVSGMALMKLVYNKNR